MYCFVFVVSQSQVVWLLVTTPPVKLSGSILVVLNLSVLLVATYPKINLHVIV